MLNIPHFRGVFMRNKLPKKIKDIESGIINLDNSNGKGTHWTAYTKIGKNIIYFDSYGNLHPPKEVISYFNTNGKNTIKYNYDQLQKFNQTNCGQLSLQFLYKNTKH